jgi:uncharacterized RDD family membrane protein YckC
VAGMTPGDRPPDAPPDAGRPPAASPYGDGPVPPGAMTAGRPGAREPVVHGPPASWGSRVVALVIDALVVGVIGAVILGAFARGFGGVFEDPAADVLSLLVGLLLGLAAVTLAALLYAPLLMARTDGRTLGKMAMGIRVVRADGRRVDFLWAALREAVVKGLGLGTAAALTGGIAYLVDGLWPLFEGRRRALHDIVVDSLVVAD